MAKPLQKILLPLSILPSFLSASAKIGRGILVFLSNYEKIIPILLTEMEGIPYYIKGNFICLAPAFAFLPILAPIKQSFIFFHFKWQLTRQIQSIDAIT
ncbi:MAG TPA: hypothetical protein PKA00_13745 [Saprospiraceae bacterium]|nr:hypothetical protein [Saprospiraceae bacterium]HMQ83974.1 hypothetical protein [Saprospiraceae bacterium]